MLYQAFGHYASISARVFCYLNKYAFGHYETFSVWLHSCLVGEMWPKNTYLLSTNGYDICHQLIAYIALCQNVPSLHLNMKLYCTACSPFYKSYFVNIQALFSFSCIFLSNLSHQGVSCILYPELDLSLLLWGTLQPVDL